MAKLLRRSGSPQCGMAVIETTCLLALAAILLIGIGRYVDSTILTGMTDTATRLFNGSSKGGPASDGNHDNPIEIVPGESPPNDSGPTDIARPNPSADVAALEKAVYDELIASWGASADGAERAAHTLATLRDEIFDAATANGISPELLAAVLAIEQMNRGSTIDQLADDLGLTDSIGIAQIKPWTLAMAEGEIPFLEAQVDGLTGSARRVALEAVRAQVKRNYDALPQSVKAGLRARLNDPKKSIHAAATILASLKDRANRYPGRPFSSLSDAEKGVIATEYNLGPTNTPASSAKPSGYGRGAVELAKTAAIASIFQ